MTMASTEPVLKEAPSGLALFLRNSITHPLRTAAHAPSSKALGREMVRATLQGLEGMTGPVVEFGPGTGAFTDRLLEAGIHPTDLILVEQSEAFAAFLRRRYPGATVIEGDAFAALPRLRGVDARGVISGLPLVQFPAATRLRFLHHCLDRVLQPGGRLSQFTYGVTSPVILGRARAVEVRASRRVWWNLYPARVWTYSRET